MIGGYMGKILFVNLSTGEIKEETPDESIYRDYMGGYGLGARILYDRQKSGVDALGPDNILGIVTGPLTGTPAPTGARYCAVAKSPLTGGWGDANSGGHFAPVLKASGYDAVFFTGVSEKPVYLFIDNGKAELKDAGNLWGKDCYETEDILKDELGKDIESISIGPSGEKLSLISCIITDRGAAAGRSGLGAVMGSKKLKALAAKGNKEVPMADKAEADRIRDEIVDSMGKPGPDGRPSFVDRFGKYGTSSMAGRSALSGDTPVKNWGGIGVKDTPDVSGLDGDLAIENVLRRAGCWHCPIACESRLKAGIGEYKYPEGIRRVEYETQGSFGVLCGNTDKESINMATHICNSYGLDTISAGSIIAFAMELYENGIITKTDTDGIELNWGNHKAMIEMTWKMAKREGLGDILADGVKVAAEKIGKGAEEYAVHIGGQELGMHDPKLLGMGGKYPSVRYHIDATPGRHTQGFGKSGFGTHITNASGLCLFSGMAMGPNGAKYTADIMKAVTGLDRTTDELNVVAERIANIRHAFNLREGVVEKNWPVHSRILGIPPQKEGPLAGVTCDHDTGMQENLKELDWDLETTKPSKKKLLELGLDDIAKELWP
ncbi:aldehyde ferredoxin oxidoreductase family protein [Chloroflexota bacterium]